MYDIIVGKCPLCEKLSAHEKHAFKIQLFQCGACGGINHSRQIIQLFEVTRSKPQAAWELVR